MAIKFTYDEITKAVPELLNVVLDPEAKQDFNNVAKVMGTRNPEIVWGAINALQTGPSSMTPALEALLASKV